MGTASVSPPEAVLTELVIVTLLASVAESHHTLTVAVGTFNWMEDYGGKKWREKKMRNKTLSQNKEKCSQTGTVFFCCVLWFQRLVSSGWEENYVYSWTLTTLFTHVCGGGGNERGWRIGLLLTTNFPLHFQLLRYENINYLNWLVFPPNCSLSPGDQHGSLEDSEAQQMNTTDSPLGGEKWKTGRKKKGKWGRVWKLDKRIELFH